MDLLIKKPITKDSIVSFRLLSGEEIVGKLVSDDGASVVISKPINVVLQPSPQGIAMAFMPYMSSIDDGNITFKHTHIVTGLIQSRDDVRDSYIRATTGIEVVKGGLIT